MRDSSVYPLWPLTYLYIHQYSFDDEELAFRARYPPSARSPQMASPARMMVSRSPNSNMSQGAATISQFFSKIVQYSACNMYPTDMGRTSSWDGSSTLPPGGSHAFTPNGSHHRAAYSQDVRASDILLSGYPYAQSTRSHDHSAYSSASTASIQHSATSYQPQPSWDSRHSQPWNSHVPSNGGSGIYASADVANSGRHWSA